jgi:hypothetical protein
MKTNNPPRTAIRGRAGVAKQGGDSEQSLISKSPARKPSPPRKPSRKPAPSSGLDERPAYEPTAPKVTRGRAWEDYSRREIDLDAEQLAKTLNHELAKTFNDAFKEVSDLDWMGDPKQDAWYWCCHGELFELLDTVLLMMVEMDVTGDEATAIASATRKHFHRAVARWRVHHLELRDARLALWEEAEAQGGWLIPNTSWAIFPGDDEPARKAKPTRKANPAQHVLR